MSAPSRQRASRRAAVSLLLALLALACTGPTPPTAAPSGEVLPGPTRATSDPVAAPSAAPTAGSPASFDPAAELFEPAGQPALPGLYLPASYRVRGSDHFAFIQAPTRCDEVIAVLGAGQWAVATRAATPHLTPDPEQGVPELPSIEWLLMRMGEEIALARVGGDETGCTAQVWRAGRQPLQASGALEHAGTAQAIQTLCMAADGQAMLTSLYIADGAAAMLQTQVPLVVGRHPIDAQTELTLGPATVPFERLPSLLTAWSGDEEPFPEMEAFFPADFEAGAWEGAVVVSSVDPLIGEITFENLRDERGRAQQLRAGFRCDLPPGQLARAGAADRPTPQPTVTPPPGSLRITIAAGPHEGTHQVTDGELSCSLGLFAEGSWTLVWSPSGEPQQGRLQSLLASVPAAGGRASMTLIMGDDFDHDWFDTERATGEVTDDGSAVLFNIRGSTRRGIDLAVEATCHDVERF